jgi:hypothetical protein
MTGSGGTVRAGAGVWLSYTEYLEMKTRERYEMVHITG